MKSLQGHLLIAGPQLLDPNFHHAVVLIVEHSDEGAMGLVLNRPTGTTIREAWEQVRDSYCPSEELLHQGGPCEGPLMVVHTAKAQAQARITRGIYFSADSDDVEQLITADHDPMRFFVGYAGWDAGQLEAELESNSWLTLPARRSHVFGEVEWEDVMKEASRSMTFAGLNPKLIPRDPSMN